MASSHIKTLSVEGFGDFLLAEGFSAAVTDKFEENGIDGETFLMMTDEHLKEVAPKIVDRIKLKKIQDSTVPRELEKENVPAASNKRPLLQSPKTSSSNSEATCSSSQWHLTFKIPDRFSVNTEEGIKSGVMTKSVRTEIVQAIAFGMLAFTRDPSKEEYNTVCQKLVEKYPTLRDKIGKKGYGSWKEKVRNRFKYLRRPSKENSKQAGMEPPSKRSRHLPDDSYDDETFETDLVALQSECKKRKRDRSMADIQDLTRKTYSKRRQWIQQHQPHVSVILEKYPSLEIRKVFREEFKTIIGLESDVSIHSLLENWPTWKQRIVAYSKLESKHRRKVQQLLATLDEETAQEDNDLVVLQLLSEFLIPKNKSERLIHFAEGADNLSVCASSISMTQPYLMVCRSTEETTYHIVVEKEPTCELSVFSSALLHLFGAYYVYDIAYPKPLYALLITLQHHVLGLDDSQPTPKSVVEIVSSLKAMDKTISD